MSGQGGMTDRDLATPPDAGAGDSVDDVDPGPPPVETRKKWPPAVNAQMAVAPGIERSTALAWLHARCIDCDEFKRIVHVDGTLVSIDEDRVRYQALTLDQRVMDLLTPEEVEAISDPSEANWIRPFPVSVFDLVELKRGPNGYLFDVDLRELESVLWDAADGGSHWLAFEAPAARDLEEVLAGLDCGAVDLRQKAAAHGLHAETNLRKAQALEHYRQHRHEFKDKEVAADALAKLVPLSRKTLRKLLKGK